MAQLLRVQFKDFGGICLLNHHPLGIDHQSNVFSQISVLNCKFLLLLFCGRTCSMGIKQKCGERNFSNSKLCPLSIVQCDNMRRSKLGSQEYCCILSDVNIGLEQSENENPAREESVEVIEFWGFVYHFFYRSTRTCGLVINSSWSVAATLPTCVRVQQSVETLCIHLAILLAVSPSVHTRALCSCTQCCSMNLFSIETHQWRSSADRVLKS